MAALREREGEELSHLQGRFSASSLSLSLSRKERRRRPRGTKVVIVKVDGKREREEKKGKEKAECVCWRQAGGRWVGSSPWAFFLFLFLGGWDQHVIFSSLKTRRRGRPCFSLGRTTTTKGEKEVSFLGRSNPATHFHWISGGGRGRLLLPPSSSPWVGRWGEREMFLLQTRFVGEL